MKYFSIQGSLNNKILGQYPQVENVIYNCNVWDDPLFIDRFYFEKINIQPIVANPVLFSKSKLTDLIDIWDMGFSFTILISGKLKSILENYINEVQFYQCSIFKDKIEYSDYWLLNIYKFSDEFVDFKKSKVSIRIRRKEGGTDVVFPEVNSFEHFLSLDKSHKEKMEIVSIDKTYFKDYLSEDFFALKYVFGSIYYVSEKLRTEIEDAGCTGIEFQPAEFSTTEWLQGGEREKIYGKAS